MAKGSLKQIDLLQAKEANSIEPYFRYKKIY